MNKTVIELQVYAIVVKECNQFGKLIQCKEAMELVCRKLLKLFPNVIIIFCFYSIAVPRVLLSLGISRIIFSQPLRFHLCTENSID